MILKSIIISRTDSIGDVVLTLPMCAVIKKHFPDCRIIFLGRDYTRAVIEACPYVDAFDSWDAWKDSSPQEQIEALESWEADAIIHVFPRKELLWVAKRARIPIRIATGRRLHTITKANKLVFFTRKKSKLHEAQLNLKLLKPLGIDEIPDLETLGRMNRLVPQQTLDPNWQALLDPKRTNVILHPKSKGSAVEWGLDNFKELIAALPQEKFKIFVSGTEAEGKLIGESWNIHELPVEDLTGKMGLPQFIAFIAKADALVAASTGPLHIAASLGIKAVGLYSPKRPIHPGRWAPIGENAIVLEAQQHPLPGEKLNIAVAEVVNVLYQ